VTRRPGADLASLRNSSGSRAEPRLRIDATPAEPSTPTPTSMPVSTPETDAENEVVPTPTPGPGEAAEDSGSVGSVTSTAADLGEDSDTATSTIVLAEPARPLPQPIRQIALSGVRMTTNRPGQVQFVFSLRDENGLTLDIPAKDVRSAKKIYELFVAPEREDDATDAEGSGPGARRVGPLWTRALQDHKSALGRTLP